MTDYIISTVSAIVGRDDWQADLRMGGYVAIATLVVVALVAGFMAWRTR